jgi:purine-binding chemotaxis protein CheW
MENQFVVFDLGSEDYGVPISSVESIIKVQQITKVPHAPSFVEGVTNIRGKVLPVIDLRKRFDIEAKETDKNSRIIITRYGQTEIGLTVDGVSEVLTVPDEAIEAAPRITTTADSVFITGIAKIGGRLVILLDLKLILSEHEQASLSDIDVPVEA